MSVLLIGVMPALLEGMSEFLPAQSVVVLEERGIVAARAAHLGREEPLLGPDRPYPCVRDVLMADYVQSDDYLDPVLRAHEQDPFTAVVPGGEYAVPAAAVVADKLGVPGAGAEVAPVFADKVLLREAAERAGLVCPQWTEVFDADDVRAFAAGQPGGIVLKPADRAGSLGVQLLDGDSDFAEAWTHTTASAGDPSVPDRPLARRFLVEQRVPGREFVVITLVRDGRIVFETISDTLVYEGRHPVEAGHNLPARLDRESEQQLHTAMRRLVAEIGVGTAMLNADWILTEDGPVVVDCAARIPGNRLVFMTELAYGVNMTRAFITVLQGGEVSLPQVPTSRAAIRFCVAEPGVVTALEGVAEARRVAGVLGVVVDTEVGATLPAVTHAHSRKVSVISCGPNAAAGADRAAAMVRIRTQPVDGTVDKWRAS